MKELIDAVAELAMEDSHRGRAESREVAEEWVRNWIRRTAAEIYRQRWMSDEEIAKEARDASCPAAKEEGK